jgi:hypothetical protein
VSLLTLVLPGEILFVPVNCTCAHNSYKLSTAKATNNIMTESSPPAIIETETSMGPRNGDNPIKKPTLEDSAEQRSDSGGAEPSSFKSRTTPAGGAMTTQAAPESPYKPEDDETSATEGDDATATLEGDEMAAGEEIEDFKSVGSRPPAAPAPAPSTTVFSGEDEDDIEENDVCPGSTAGSEEDGEGAGNNDGNEKQLEQEENETANETQSPEIVNTLSSLLTPRGPAEPSSRNESLLDIVIQFFDDFGIVNRKRNDLSEDRTVFSFGTQLQNCNLDNRFDVREAKKLVAFYCISPLRIPATKRATAMEFFTRANYDLLNGNFEFDLRDGEFRYNVSSTFVGAEVTHETIRYMYLVAANTMSRYFDGLMQVVYSEKDPAAAVRDCEGPEAEPPSSPQQ